jgi:endoplasmic reticulum-Golgi intermediate compartment protein 3
VQEAYRARGWAFTNPDEIAQCMQEGFSEKMKLQRNEGCQVYGYILVKKVAGNFHIAPGKSFQQHHMHVHDLKPYGADSFNLRLVVLRRCEVLVWWGGCGVFAEYVCVRVSLYG